MLNVKKGSHLVALVYPEKIEYCVIVVNAPDERIKHFNVSEDYFYSMVFKVPYIDIYSDAFTFSITLSEIPFKLKYFKKILHKLVDIAQGATKWNN